ncbi:MAG: O-antigen ligase family protein [Nitrospira sp.]|jgi:O-antigen ligase|nr:O-antigen ligase family protein [Nitrospira sp.]
MASLIHQVRHVPAGLASSIQALDAQVEKETKFAFQCFVWFGVIVFIAPQAFVPALSALGIGKIVMFLALFSYVKFAFSQGHLSFAEGSELKIVAWLLLLSLLSVGFSRWPGGSLQFFMDYAWKAGVVFFLTANLLTSRERAQKFCWMFVFFAAVNSLIGLQNWRTGNMISGAANRIEGGFAPLAMNPNDLGLLLDMCLPLAWYAYVTATTKATRYMAGLTLIAASVTVVITFSRGAFLGLLVVAGLLVWKIAKGKRMQVLLLISVLLPVVLVVLPAGYSDRMLSIVQSDLDETGSREHRIKLMKAGVASMVEHPLGVGLGMNILTAADSGAGWNVIHNAYLQVGVELGIVGFILYILLISKTYQGLTAIERSPVRNIANLAFAIRLSLIAYMVGAFFGPVAYNFYFFYPGGMAVALKSLVKRAPHLMDAKKAEAI